MDPNGDVRLYEHAGQVVAAIRARQAKAARKGRSTVTRLEWRKVPAGFVPPEATP